MSTDRKVAHGVVNGGVTFDELEQAFGEVIERNRKRQTMEPCPREALFAHAFFHLDNGEEPDDMGVVPNELPFEAIWMVTSYKGIAICAFVERLGDTGFIRPDYLWYPRAIQGHLILTNEQEIDSKCAFLIDRALATLLRSHLAEVDSPVQASINRGRAKAKNDPLPELPAFIRVSLEPPLESGPQGGTHASPQGHERRGHWRTYKASGRRVWINETKVNGGSVVPRSYRVG